MCAESVWARQSNYASMNRIKSSSLSNGDGAELKWTNASAECLSWYRMLLLLILSSYVQLHVFGFASCCVVALFAALVCTEHTMHNRTQHRAHSTQTKFQRNANATTESPDRVCRRNKLFRCVAWNCKNWHKCAHHFTGGKSRSISGTSAYHFIHRICNYIAYFVHRIRRYELGKWTHLLIRRFVRSHSLHVN